MKAFTIGICDKGGTRRELTELEARVLKLKVKKAHAWHDYKAALDELRRLENGVVDILKEVKV